MPNDDDTKASGSKATKSVSWKIELASLVTKRSTYKRKVTLALSSAERCDGPGSSLDVYLEQVRLNVDHVSLTDNKILETMIGGECTEEELNVEADKQVEYACAIKMKLNEYEACKVKAKSDDTCVTYAKDIKLPHLKVPTFSGEGRDHLKYYAFLTAFNNAIGNRKTLTDSAKLTYLKGYVSGYAAKLVEHLSIDDQNYRTALDLLEREFLKKDAIINDLIDKLMGLKCKFDVTYRETKVLISEVRGLLADLKIHGCDVLAENSACTIVSNIVFGKLPTPFKQELGRRVNNCYPNLNQIFANYVEVIETLNLRKNSQPEHDSNKQFVPRHNHEKQMVQSEPKVFSNASVASPARKACKFCSGFSHSMLNCTVYRTPQARFERCDDLKLCRKCTSSKHSHKNCSNTLDYQCKFCNETSHIAALCERATGGSLETHYCINSSTDISSVFLLPTITIPVTKGNMTYPARFLIDTGSQRSYVSGKVLEGIKFPSDRKSIRYNVNSFVHRGTKDLSEVSLLFSFPRNINMQMPVLVDESFSLQFRIYGLKDAVNNIKAQNKLADVAFDNQSQDVILDGILGIDLIQCLTFTTVPCMKGFAFDIGGSIVPFGNVEHFLTRPQVVSMRNEMDSLSLEQQACVNFFLDPKLRYSDPIADVIESNVEGNLDKIFSLESIGIDENETMCESDEMIVQDFESNIKFIDGHYNVKLPWNDKVKDVPQSFGVAHTVLERDISTLQTNNLLADYEAILQEQLHEGVLEEVPLSNKDGKVFIPHRAVVRTDPNVSTKVRPVLNCSLNYNKLPSLNEASFPGLDMMGNLFNLLIGLRHDTYLALSDIRRAFLQIKLWSEDDRNKFCILWKRNGKLIAYRYTSIVFGYVASPFVLGYVIKYHLRKYPDDLCNYFLSNGLYVDNLFMSSNSSEELEKLYRTAYERMTEGGFLLRSWSTNCPELQAKFEKDGISSELTDSGMEKILGYKYDLNNDNLSVSNHDFSIQGKLTKRSVLSKLAKCFDPLGFVNPVTVRGKMLMRDMWKAGLGWDDEISAEMGTSCEENNSSQVQTSVTFGVWAIGVRKQRAGCILGMVFWG